MAELRIILIAIGDELLMGQVLDTNSNWIARKLSDNGLRLHRLIWSADSDSDIRHNLAIARKESDAVILTGGLGPTHDDLTRPIIADFFGDRLEFRDDLAQNITKRYRSRGLNPAPGWESMAMFPTRASPIPNHYGAAVGIHYLTEDFNLFALPGVPSEMRGMIDQYVLPYLIKLRTGVYDFRVIRTTGIGESLLAAKIGDVRQLDPVQLAFLPSLESGVSLRLSLYGDESDNVEMTLNRAEKLVTTAVRQYIYTVGRESIEEVILEQMRKRGLKLAVAESCTGGMLASRLIGVSGSSAVLERGWVTYSNQSKVEQLGVRIETLERYGAVSEQTALEMASGACARAKTQVGVSITGIAGPGGGTEDKPVGLVYIGLSFDGQVEVVRHHFTGDREENRRRATLAALTLLFNRVKIDRE